MGNNYLGGLKIAQDHNWTVDLQCHEGFIDGRIKESHKAKLLIFFLKKVLCVHSA